MGFVTTGLINVDASAAFEVEVSPDARDLMGLLIETDGALRFSGWILGPHLQGATVRGGIVKGFNVRGAGAVGVPYHEVSRELYLSFAPIPLEVNTSGGTIEVSEGAAAARKMEIHALFTGGGAGSLDRSAVRAVIKEEAQARRV